MCTVHTVCSPQIAFSLGQILPPTLAYLSILLLAYAQVCLHCGEDFCRGDCLKYHYDQSQRKKKEPVEDLEVVENPKNPVDEEDEEEKEKRPRMKRQMKRRPRPNTGGSTYPKK